MTTKSKKAGTKEAAFDFRTIKGFEDACKKENIDPTKLPDVSMIPEEFRKPLLAVYKIMIGYKAVNNGWKVDYGNTNQLKYFPWARVLSSGFGFSYSCSDYDFAFTSVGSRLCTDESDKAEHIFVNFNQEYKYFWL